MDGHIQPPGYVETAQAKADLVALFQSGFVTGCLHAVAQIEQHAKAGRIDLVVQACAAIREEVTGTPRPPADTYQLRRTA